MAIEEPRKPKADLQSGSVEIRLIEEHLRDLGERISDAGRELDAYKTKTAAALGAGAFLFLLAIGGVYDIASNNLTLWFSVGVTREKLYWLTGALAFASLALFALALTRNRLRDVEAEERLAEMEREFAGLLDRRDEISQLGGK